MSSLGLDNTAIFNHQLYASMSKGTETMAWAEACNAL